MDKHPITNIFIITKNRQIMEKDKSHCLTCKDKRHLNDIKSLTNVDIERLTQAYNYVIKASQMNDEKWDFVEDVYLELFPMKNVINRQCRECLIRVAKSIEYEYRRLTSKK